LSGFLNVKKSLPDSSADDTGSGKRQQADFGERIFYEFPAVRPGIN
jgi:hypothetical protein